MNQNEYIVKHDRDGLIFRTGITGVFIAYSIFLLTDVWNDVGTGAKIGFVVMITVVFTFFISMLRELYQGRNEVILTKYGIDLYLER